MTTNEKAIVNLENKDIQAKEENGTVYVCIGFTELELAEFEINYQATEYDRDNLQPLQNIEAIKEYNEDKHIDLTEKQKITLDETEVEDYLDWYKDNF